MIDGFLAARSENDAAATAAAIVAALAEHDLSLVARIDHAEAAAKAGLALGPTELLIFGNPRGGTPLMQAARTIGIDLPLRMLVWTDEHAATWIGHDDPRWLARRHGMSADSPAVARLAEVLRQIVTAALQTQPIDQGDRQ